VAELHESLLVACRKQLLRHGLKEAKSPMPTFRPDIFAQRRSKHGRVIRELAVEAEIASTLFSEHTSHQLMLLDDYIAYQGKRGIKVDGYLLVPKGRANAALAKSVLDTLFPVRSVIRILTC
jgi:hypothetical protein